MRILYVTTTFPVFSETFLQREVRAMLEQGVTLRIVSLHGGKPEFEGQPVERFSKLRLLKLLYKLPLAYARNFPNLWQATGLLWSRRPTCGLNFFENLLGFGAAIELEQEARAFGPELIHCVWSSAPGAFGLLAKTLTGVPFSMGAHAYDLFEYGGDWLLEAKAHRASLIHVSTEVARERVRSLVDGEKVVLIRRGLNRLPEFKSLRPNRAVLRVVCVARLVEKKGFPYQLEIYRAMREAGISFEALIIGEGPERGAIEQGIEEKGLRGSVMLTGQLSETEVMEQLQWADALFHTGIIAASGDRDGLPNVVPEAMASGVVVFGSPVSGVVEAIEDRQTGFLCDPADPQRWVDRLREIQAQDELCEGLRRGARAWVEKEFLAETNTGRLLECMRRRL